MKPSIQTLGQILYSPSQYVIPVFQRNYRWEEPQWAKLWSSLQEIQQPEKRGNHFMGFLVFVPGLPQPGQHTTFHLIDGQQRLTSLSLMLTAIRNVARETDQPDLATEIHEYFLVHPLKKGEQHYRLLPKERDHDSYLAIVNGTTEPSGRMADALDYFEVRLAEATAATSAALRSVFDTICQRLEFMCATLEAENAYNIFKSLNSTGVPLGASDLIRNFVFMHVAPDEQDEFDREYWDLLEARFANLDGTLDEERFSRFFRDYLMSSGRYVPPKETFPSFEARYEATGFVPKDLARILLRASDHYEIISGTQPDKSPKVSGALAGLNDLESSTTYPLLLALFALRDAGTIDSEKLAYAVEMLKGFIMRRFICSESSRGYGRMFVRALATPSDDPMQTLEEFLLERGWPDDHRFQVAFVEFPLYLRGYTREVLRALEEARGHKEPADLKNAQVEHVMPQTLSNSWHESLGEEAERLHAALLHRPGNLTLSAYNQELWNHAFQIKRERYAQSNIALTRELADQSAWGEAQIRDRGWKLATDATMIWIGPKDPVTVLESATGGPQGEPHRHEIRRGFWAGLNDYLVGLHPELPDFEARPTWTIRLPSGIRHIGIELRLGLRDELVGIDVWFWREASLPIWTRVRDDPTTYNEQLAASWTFEQLDGRARMYLEHSVPNIRDASSWPLAYEWFGKKLPLIYERIAPMLRIEMDVSPTLR